MKRVLSEIGSVGNVSVCDRCSQVHVAYGRMALNFSREEFASLAEMFSTAAQKLGEPARAQVWQQAPAVKTAVLH